MEADQVRAEVRDFLVTRRGRITPAEAGLLACGGLRRVTGLRREELAMLAGPSVEYYARLERGNLRGASESVLEALARAPRLSEVERLHLYDLARAANAGRCQPRSATPRQVRPGVQRILDALAVPALVGNGRGDNIAANQVARALFAPQLDSPAGGNSFRFLLLDPVAHDFYPEWDRLVDDSVALLRTQVGQAPYDKVLTDLIGELSARSEVFRGRWARHDVRLHLTGSKRIRHPLVGELDLRFESLPLPADPGQFMAVYTAEPQSPTEQALKFLASWAAESSQAE